MVLTSIVISRPSHSAKAASHRGAPRPSSVISTRKLNEVNGYTSGLLDPHGAVAGAHEPDGQEGERARRGDAPLPHEPALVDGGRRIRRVPGRDAVALVRAGSGERA